MISKDKCKNIILQLINDITWKRRKNYETSYKDIKGKKKTWMLQKWESKIKTILKDQWFWICMYAGGDNDLCVSDYTQRNKD